MNRDADGEARAPFVLDHFGTGAAGAGEQLVGQVGVQPGILLERQAGRRSRIDQIGTMLSPCSPRITAVTCVGAALSVVGDQAAKADRVELRSQADALAQGGRSSRSAAR